VRRAIGPTVCGLAALTLVLSSCAKAEQEIDRNDCIDVTHVGSQDIPVGGLRLCVGDGGRFREDSVIENRWTFFFDLAMYRRLNSFVIKNVKQPAEVGDEPQTSFSVTWDTREGKRKYIVASRNACTYVKELVQTVTGGAYAKFHQVGEDMWSREGCRRIAPSPNFWD
jgi:hypothetical protein